jgi:hypothetical protein
MVLLTFGEQVVSLVREHAPKAAIAFNTSGGCERCRSS